MNQGFPVRAVAGCFALASFGVAVVSGLFADRSASAILGAALSALVVGQIVGTVAGLLVAKALEESLTSYRARNPMPGVAPTRGVEAAPRAPGRSA